MPVKGRPVFKSAQEDDLQGKTTLCAQKYNSFARTVTQEEALEYANSGVTIIASYISNQVEPGNVEFGGHVAVVAPGIELKDSNGQGGKVVSVYNVGKTNKVGTLGEAFGNIDVQLFIMESDYKSMNGNKSESISSEDNNWGQILTDIISMFKKEYNSDEKK